MNENNSEELNAEADTWDPDQLPQEIETIETSQAEILASDAVTLDPDEDSIGIGSEDPVEQTIIEKLQSQLHESQKQALIAAADLENYRKRASKNTQEQIKYAALPMISELLEAVDNLNRAIESADTESADSGLLEGVKMVSGQILNILKSNHCEPIPSVGEPFDPNLHQAVQMQPSEDFPANTVMMEMRTGYRLHDRIVRPSQVFVSTGIENK